jgi:3-oxoacyl-[acyl-carrier protein] reductase
MQTNQPLQGKVAIITGAGRGIGKGIAEAYAKAGAAIACAARSEGEIRETAAAIVAAGGRAIAIPADVSDFESVQRLVEATVEAFGGVDILVINAGIPGDGLTVAESDPQAWRRTIDVNLIGAYHCAKAAIPALKKRGAGKIITIGSGQGHTGLPTLSAYGCSKAGLWMLTRILAQELAQFDIDVNELIPGITLTNILEGDAAQAQLDNPVLKNEWVKTVDDLIPIAMFMATQPRRGPTAQSFRLLRRDV